MSSPEPKRRAALPSLAIACGAVLALAGCFRPLYGALPNGVSMKDTLAAIDVIAPPDVPGQERMGHYLRNELAFDLDGGNAGSDKRYRLELSVSESVQTAIVNTQTGNAESATLIATAQYTLKRLDGGPVTGGKATASASYDRSPQRFASLRAAREAEILVAKQLAEQIRTRLAAHFAASGA